MLPNDAKASIAALIRASLASGRDELTLLSTATNKKDFEFIIHLLYSHYACVHVHCKMLLAYSSFLTHFSQKSDDSLLIGSCVDF